MLTVTKVDENILDSQTAKVIEGPIMQLLKFLAIFPQQNNIWSNLHYRNLADLGHRFVKISE